MKARERLIVALDVPEEAMAMVLVDALAGQVGMFKVGSQLFTAAGPDVVREIVGRGEHVFLDLKFHDIPNTVAGAVASASHSAFPSSPCTPSEARRCSRRRRGPFPRWECGSWRSRSSPATTRRAWARSASAGRWPRRCASWAGWPAPRASTGSGRLAAEAAFAALADGEVAGRPGALDGYDAAIRESYLWKEMREARNMRQVFDKGFFMGGALASAMTVTKGKLPPKDYPNHANASRPLLRTDRAAAYPSPDGALTFDKLSSVFASGNRTRDDQPNHVRVQERVPREVAEMWAWMCPAQVYEVGDEHDDGTVEVRMTPSNCVQCGAITAKGGRLTPPEGGSGPEYTQT